MKVTVNIELDETWDEYKNINPELFIEDLFDGFSKAGVEKIELIDIE